MLRFLAPFAAVVSLMAISSPAALAARCSDYPNQAAAQHAADTRDADGDGIYCEDLPGKPAPDLFLHAAERMRVAPQRCAVVEDSRYGVQAGCAAGMRVFAYASGFVDARLLTGERTTLFTDMRELPGLLGNERPLGSGTS